MSTISLVVTGVPNDRRAETIACIRKITGKSLGEITRRLKSGEPLAEYTLFANNHEAVALELRQLLAAIPPIGATLRLFELVTGNNPFEITPEVLNNILASSDEEVRRQQESWDEHGHA